GPGSAAGPCGAGPRSIRPRVPARGLARSPQRDPDLRGRRLGRRPVHRDAVRGGLGPSDAVSRGGSAGACTGDRDPPSGRVRLDAAHQQGLVHRDVKPANVLLARPRSSEPVEHVYLSDFGLTKRSAGDSAVTGTGQFVGTLDYAAPEQFKGETPDARTDVYSLGCVLFECLTGRPPFRSENDAGLMYAHLQQPPPPVTSERPDLPHEIDRVVGRAMAKSPDDRPRSAGELADGAAPPLGPGA